MRVLTQNFILYSYCTARPEKPSYAPYMPNLAKYIFALKVYMQNSFISHLICQKTF